jgi:hypothetical protein
MDHQVDVSVCVLSRRKVCEGSLFRVTSCLGELTGKDLDAIDKLLINHIAPVYISFWEGAEILSTQYNTAGKALLSLPETAGESAMVH